MYMNYKELKELFQDAVKADLYNQEMGLNNAGVPIRALRIKELSNMALAIRKYGLDGSEYMENWRGREFLRNL